MKENKTFKITDSDLSTAANVFVAKQNYSSLDCYEVVQKDKNSRMDISKKFKDYLEYDDNFKREIVYYPLYKYNTNSSFSWQTKSSNTDNVYYENTKIGSIKTTVTTDHEQHNVKKDSEIKVKKEHKELKVDRVSLSDLEEISKVQNNKVCAYSDKLIFTEEENKNNAINIAREGKARSTNSYTKYRVNMILVPILRYRMVFNNKEYCFEMNMNNGEYVTKYPQKAFFSLTKNLLAFLYWFMRIASLLIPIGLPVYGFIAHGYIGNFWKNLLFSVLLIGLIILGFFTLILSGGKRMFTFEKCTKTLNPIPTIKTFAWLTIAFALILALTLISCKNCFNLL